MTTMAETIPRDKEDALPGTEANHPSDATDIQNHTVLSNGDEMENEKKDLESGNPDALTSSEDGTEQGEAAPAVQEFKRPFGTGRWVSVLTGLYLGAFLYGM